MNWNELTERERQVWAAAYANAMTLKWTVEAALLSAGRAVKLLREYDPDKTTAYRTAPNVVVQRGTIFLEGEAGENIEQATRRAANASQNAGGLVVLNFNDTEVKVYPTVWETAAASYFTQRRPK